MDFLKKHYEKILLGAMLAGLIGVLVFMIFYIASQKSEMQAMSESLTNPHVRALTNLDMTMEDSATLRSKTPYTLDLETTNKLFNPMEWQRALDNTLILKSAHTGLQIAVVTNCTPLYFIVSLESATTNELGPRYVIRVERQAAPLARNRHSMPHYVSPGDKANDAFQLLSVKGPPEDPTEVDLKLVDSGDVIAISKDKPYHRIDGYTADLRYDPEKINRKRLRVGDRISIAGVDYSVVDVKQDEFILMDQSNQKKTSLPIAP